MSDNNNSDQNGTAKNTADKQSARDTFHAKRRRARRDQAQERRQKAIGKQGDNKPPAPGSFEFGPAIYGLHTVRAAISNPRRKNRGLMATQNGHARLTEGLEDAVNLPEVEIVSPKKLDNIVGADAVHQGVVLLTEPIEPLPFSQFSQHKSIMILDQITDPHNVGAIMRSAVALGVGALLTTTRHSAAQTGVLAKSASGALDMIEFCEVTNLANAIEELHKIGFITLGLDSEGAEDMAQTLPQMPSDANIALVMGNEGKGLRAKTRDTVTHLARLDMPGPIKSLNVSNAAVLAAYQLHLHRTG